MLFQLLKLKRVEWVEGQTSAQQIKRSFLGLLCLRLLSCVIDRSLSLQRRLASSFLFHPERTSTRFFQRGLRSQASPWHPTPACLWGRGEGAGADKWDSAVLEPIIMPRLSLTDAGDLNSVTQTYISLSGSVCVCVCIKDMHDILPYPLPRSRCLVCRHRRAISDRPNTHVPAAARRAQTHTIWFNPGWIFWAVFRCVGCSRSTRLQRDNGVQVYEYMLNVRILWGTDTLEPAFISVFSLSDRSWWNTLTTPPTRAIWGWRWTPWRYANRVNHAPFLACSASHLVAPAFGL